MNQTAVFSEFEGRPARFFGKRYWFVWLAVAFLFGTLIVLFLGHFAGANCFRISIKALVDGYDIAPVDLVHGYLAQANHGFFYLMFAPLAVCVAGLFLRSIESGLQELKSQNRLDDEGYCWITNTNRKVFRWILWTLIALLIGWNLNRELRSIPAAESETTFHMGYVQVFSLNKWGKRLERSENAWLNLAKFDDRGLMAGTLEKAYPFFSENQRLAWLNAGAVRVPGLQKPFSKTSLAAIQPGRFAVDPGTAIKLGLMRIQITTQRNKENSSLELQYAFAVAVQLLEGTFHGFALWVALKAIFFLLFIWRLLPRNEFQSPKIEPNCYDETRRFGLAALHPVYNWIVVILLFGCVALSLVFVSGPVSLPNDAVSHSHTIGTLVFIAVAVVVFLLALALGPMFAFHKRLKWKQDQEVALLNQQIANIGSGSTEAGKVEEKLELVKSQLTWPKQEKKFWVMLTVGLAFGAIPLASPVAGAVGFIPEPVASRLTIARQIDTLAENLSQRIYDLGWQPK